jgi:hypothetical protein
MPQMLLSLPSTLDGVSLCRFVDGFIRGCEGGVIPTEVVINFSALSFVKPAGVTFLRNFISWLRKKNVTVFFSNHENIGNRAIKFLDDSLFFESHLGMRISEHSSPRDTTRPLVSIHHRESHQWLRQNLVPWLAGRLATREGTLYRFQVCVSEIFNNIQDHTDLDIGSIFAQHFPNMNRVNIAVADFGRGIPESVRQVCPGLTDVQAIEKAVQRGFTTKGVPTNRGEGLDFLLETVVKSNGGSVTIFSLGGAVKFYRSGTEVVGYGFSDLGFCPGTTIDIELRTDTIFDLDDEEEDLQW